MKKKAEIFAARLVQFYRDAGMDKGKALAKGRAWMEEVKAMIEIKFGGKS